MRVKGQDDSHSLSTKTSVSLSDILNKVKFGPFQFLLSLGLSMALWPYSMEFILLSVLQPLSKCLWTASNTITDRTEMIVWLGMAITAPIWGLLSDRMGRRRVIIVAVLGHIISTICLVFSPSSEVFNITMFLRGCFLSCLLQCYVLLSEYCPSNYRGGFIALNHMLCLCGGLFVMMCSQEFMKMPQDWKSLIIFTIMPRGVPVFCTPDYALNIIYNGVLLDTGKPILLLLGWQNDGNKEMLYNFSLLKWKRWDSRCCGYS